MDAFIREMKTRAGELNRKPNGKILLLDHVRIDRPIIGRIMDLLNPLVVRLWGANTPYLGWVQVSIVAPSKMCRARD